jgi:Peptidase_C39 like family
LFYIVSDLHYFSFAQTRICVKYNKYYSLPKNISMFTKFYFIILTLVFCFLNSIIPVAVAQSNIIKVLSVPYINQCLKKNGNFYLNHTSNQSDKRNTKTCQNMCGGAVMVMVSSYFGRLFDNQANTLSSSNYNAIQDKMTNDYLFDKYASKYSCSDNGYQYRGAFAVTSLSRDGENCYYSSREGLIAYATAKKINSREIDPTFENFKRAIDRGNPIALSIFPHIVLVVGYTADKKIVVHDPQRNNNNPTESYSMDGNRAIYGSTGMKFAKLGQPSKFYNWFYAVEFFR